MYLLAIDIVDETIQTKEMIMEKYINLREKTIPGEGDIVVTMIVWDVATRNVTTKILAESKSVENVVRAAAHNTAPLAT